MEVTQHPPILFNISGPYGVGKDTLINGLINKFAGLIHRVRTITTRAVSAEWDPSYESLSRKAFAERVAQGRWIVNEQFSGEVAYGTNIDEIEERANAGYVCVHSVYPGPAGAGAYRQLFGKRMLSIGVLATQGDLEAQLAILRSRLIARHRDGAEELEKRIKHQKEPIAYVLNNALLDTADGKMNVFDYIVVNESLTDTAARIQAIFESGFVKNQHYGGSCRT